MKPRTRRTIAIATAALGTAGVLALAGCGGTQVTGTDGLRLTAAQTLAKAADQTSRIDTFRTTMTVDASGQGQKLHATGNARYQVRPQPAFDISFNDVQASDRAVPGEVRAVLVGDNLYVRSAALQAQQQAKPWIKISLQQAGAAWGINSDQVLQQIRSSDPQTVTKMLTASKDARAVGTGTVDGVQTTHYTGTVDVQQAIAQLDPKLRQEAQARFTGTPTLHFDLWVDGKQLPRKVVVTGGDAAHQFTATQVFHAFGQPVHITAPPASEVTDAANLHG